MGPHRFPGAVRLGIAALAVLAGAVYVSGQPAEKGPARSRVPLSKESRDCVACHEKRTPGIVAQWRGSRHARQGVGCWECHNASPKEPGAFAHEGATVLTVVTPSACANCHGAIVDEFQHSHHADAARFIGSLDNVLGEVVEGRLAAVNGCRQCHGSTVAVLKNADGSVKKSPAGAPVLDPSVWPNTGIGRINLDGSPGACSVPQPARFLE